MLSHVANEARPRPAPLQFGQVVRQPRGFHGVDQGAQLLRVNGVPIQVQPCNGQYVATIGTFRLVSIYGPSAIDVLAAAVRLLHANDSARLAQ